MTLYPEHERMLAIVIKRWLEWTLDLRAKVRRPWAIMDGEVTTQDVVFHDPDAMR